MPSLVGTQIEKYTVQSEVGHGGMAVVYRGLDTVLNREVAIKVLHPHMAAREESRARLRREALTVAKLRHENILEIYDYSGENAVESFLVTEFIHGMTLREWLDTRWRPRPALAALITHRLCIALGHAHKIGIVHRDIKPENVMIREDGCLKLMDFGIAQIIDHQKLTMTGQLLGSPAYMAPELISGKPIDARTDLFAVGVMLYQLATGSLPFSGRNPHEVLSRIADAEYPKACTICPLVDDELEKIIAKALAREPDLRYQSAEDFARDLETYLAEVGLAATSDEVTSYFSASDCERYVGLLDKRVCAALMTQAESATRAGHSARAIRLLGRVLELEKDQKQARSMLSRLRSRERTLRHLMAGAAGLAFTALTSGLVVLYYMTPPDPNNLKRDDDPQPVVVSPLQAIETPAAPPPVVNAITNTAGTPSDPPDDEPRRPTPRPSEAPTKAVRPAPVECSLDIVGMPAPVAGAGAHSLRIGTKTQRMEGWPVTFEMEGDAVQVLLRGSMYHGGRLVQRSECSAGPVELRAFPYKAQLTFSGAPPQTTVTCISGPCPDNRHHLLDDEGALLIPVTSHEEWVELEIRATGYRGIKETVRIHPGKNSHAINLVPLKR